MTERKILYALKKIDQSKNGSYYIEALLDIYYLNIEVLRYMTLKFTSVNADESIKVKHMMDNLISEIEKRPELKTIITKKNLKVLKPWLSKMDDFFKTLKNNKPDNSKMLLLEGEKVFGILKISFTKLLISPLK